MLNRMNHRLKSSLMGEISIIINEDDTALVAESKELKSLFMRRGDAKTG